MQCHKLFTNLVPRLLLKFLCVHLESLTRYDSNNYFQTLSIHHAAPGFFPLSPLASLPDVDDPAFDPFTLSVPLKAGASNKTFLRIWPIIEHVKDIFRPDFIIVQCGLDGLAGDPMATFNWSLGGEGSLGWCIHRIIHEWQGKKMLLGGGMVLLIRTSSRIPS